jgi:hypothetical protein
MTNGVRRNPKTDVASAGFATGKTGKDMPKTPEHKQWNGDMTNGVAPSSNPKGTDVKLRRVRPPVRPAWTCRKRLSTSSGTAT